MREQSRRNGLERWIIPPEVGKFFYILTKITKAKKIYEIGSYLGYSATWFAKAIPEDGKIFVNENDENRYLQATTFFKDSILADKVIIKHCDAVQNLLEIGEFFDIILIDHDKPDYCNAFLAAKKRIKKGGLIIADNVLWRNRIFKKEWGDDPSTKGVLEFNKLVNQDPNFISIIIPIGDGVSLSCSI